jgi:hypothetical protein
MDSLLPTLTVTDWVILGLMAMVPAFMAVGILQIRKDTRSHARHGPSFVKLKTSSTQRRLWRQQTHSKELIDLLDDIDTLLKQVASSDPVTPQDHREAVRLVWKSRHIPFVTLFVCSLALAGVLSAILMVIAQGPSNPIP